MTGFRLATPGSGTGFLGALAVPAELWWAVREPSVLAGMSYPHRADWRCLHDAGLHHVVCLTDDRVRYDPAPLTVTAVALEDLYVAGPTAPDEQWRRVGEAVDAVVTHVAAGRGVVVHCHAGRGRTGTVIGGALVRLGHDPEEIVEWLHRVQRGRSKRGWPEHPWQAEAVRAVRHLISLHLEAAGYDAAANTHGSPVRRAERVGTQPPTVRT